MIFMKNLSHKCTIHAQKNKKKSIDGEAIIVTVEKILESSDDV